MALYPVAPIDTVPENGNRAFLVAGRDVLLCRSGAGTFAVENRCSHQLAALEGGKVRGAYLFCPLHAVRFDLRTGSPSGTLTRKPIATFPATVADGIVTVELPD